jgi:hypothetical protein
MCLYSINWFIFIMDTDSVIFEVGTNVKYVIWMKGLGLAPASPCGILFMIKWHWDRDFLSPGRCIFPYQSRSTNAPHLPSSSEATRNRRPGDLKTVTVFRQSAA